MWQLPPQTKSDRTEMIHRTDKTDRTLRTNRKNIIDIQLDFPGHLCRADFAIIAMFYI